MPWHTFTLDFPAKPLWPNGRAHFMAKARAVKVARNAAFWEAKAAGIKAPVKRAHIHFTVYPKATGPLPDVDNAIAAQKAHQDGICDAMGLDDAHITTSHEIATQRRSCVVVNVSTGDEADKPLKGSVS